LVGSSGYGLFASVVVVDDDKEEDEEEVSILENFKKMGVDGGWLSILFFMVP
jgi:hypothetical protein